MFKKKAMLVFGFMTHSRDVKKIGGEVTVKEPNTTWEPKQIAKCNLNFSLHKNVESCHLLKWGCDGGGHQKDFLKYTIMLVLQAKNNKKIS